MSEAELRKIDLAVGTKVMGFTCNVAENMGNKMRCWNISKGKSVPFEPTTNPADAMEVLKRVAEKAWKDAQIFCVRPSGENSWEVFAHDHYDMKKSQGRHCPMYTEAPTLELAICAFALKCFP